MVFKSVNEVNGFNSIVLSVKKQETDFWFCGNTVQVVSVSPEAKQEGSPGVKMEQIFYNLV